MNSTKKKRRYACIDCDLRFRKCGCYMVWNEVWQEAAVRGNECLCIPCLEKRLGRTLTYLDFSNVPLNYMIEQGVHAAPEIVLNRLKGFLEHWKDFDHASDGYSNNRNDFQISRSCTENS